jgi:hypothetical protein
MGVGVFASRDEALTSDFSHITSEINWHGANNMLSSKGALER